MTKTFEFYWKDLTAECKKELQEFLGLDEDDNNNYDVFPFATLEVKDDSEPKYVPNNFYKVWLCGKCGFEIHKNWDHCHRCQAKIDWKNN